MVTDAPERIWLSAADSDNEREAWTDPDEGGTEYVRADLHEAALAKSAEPVAEVVNNGAQIYIDWLGKNVADFAGQKLYAAPVTTPPAAVQPERAVEAIEVYYDRQIEWSRRTFGPALRTKGIIDHIGKELKEIEADPHDLSEWIDVVILAMDGFWRHGGTASDLMPRLLAKQRKNMARTWPDWRNMSEDQAIEHDRSGDAALAKEGR